PLPPSFPTRRSSDLLAGVWGSFCAFWALLHVYYHLGAASAKIIGPATYFGWEPYRRLATFTGAPPFRDPLKGTFLGSRNGGAPVDRKSTRLNSSHVK